MTATVNTEIGGAAIGGQSGGGGAVTVAGSLVDVLAATGSELSAVDAGVDAVVFWDDSNSKQGYLEIGSGLSITDTTITGTSSFGTVVVSGQSNVVADQVNDSLTLVAGSNITITTDAATDTVTIAASGSSGPTSVGQQTLTGQASRSFTVPTTTKRITVMVNAMSGSGGGTAPIQIQLGDAGGLETSGYLGAVAQSNSTSANLSYSAQTGFCVDTAAGAGGQVYYGSVVLNLMDSTTNTWALSGNISNPAFVMSLAGIKPLSQAITTVAIVAPGTTFDGGTCNVTYE